MKDFSCTCFVFTTWSDHRLWGTKHPSFIPHFPWLHSHIQSLITVQNDRLSNVQPDWLQQFLSPATFWISVVGTQLSRHGTGWQPIFLFGQIYWAPLTPRLFKGYKIIRPQGQKAYEWCHSWRFNKTIRIRMILLHSITTNISNEPCRKGFLINITARIYTVTCPTSIFKSL